MDINYSTGKELVLSISEYSQNNMLEGHIHDSYELYVLTEGNRSLFVKDRFFSISRGDMFLIKPQTVHRTIDGETKKYVRFVCNIPGIWLKNHYDDIKVSALLKNDVIIVSPDKCGFDMVLKEIESIKNEISLNRFGIEFSVQGAILKILGIFFCHENIASKKILSSDSLNRISDIIKYINKNYADKISISMLAEKFFVSEFHMCRIFKEYTGKTVGDYITSVRLSHARRLLSETNIKISTIYKTCGFGSLSNFNRVFKEVCDKTPLQYRKNRQTHQTGL